MTTVRRARRARRVAATAAVGAAALAAGGCNLGEPPVAYPGPSGRLEAADLDDDGDLDLVGVYAPIQEDGASRVLLNAGDGTFTASAPTPAPFRGVADLALDDLDGDGAVDRVDLVHEDVFAPYSTGSIELRRGDGDGGFSAAEEIVPEAVADPAEIELRDMDGDGTLDAVVTGNETAGTSQVAIGLGDGTGALDDWAPPARVPVSAGWLGAGDVDGDGATDVLVIGHTYDGTVLGPPSLTVLLGDGDGGLGTPSTPLPLNPPGSGSTLGTAALADVDDDGALDVVGVNASGNAAVWWSQGDGDGGFAAPVYSPGGGASDVAVADIDADGHLDLVTAGIAGNGGAVHYGDGDGTFGDTHALDGGGTRRAWSVVAVPLDAGASVDVAYGRSAQDRTSDTAVLLNTLGGRRGH